MIDLGAIEHDLMIAYAARIERVRRRRRAARVTVAALAVACAFAAAAVASGIDAGLQLDPTKWAVLGRGSTDDGRGSYVHAQRTEDGSHSTFMVEHDAGLEPYQAFLLHERTKAAADATSPVPLLREPGPLCNPEQLGRAEVIALQTIGRLPVGTSSADAKEAIAIDLDDAFGTTACRGLEWAGEQAQLVAAGTEPRSLLMPAAR